MVHGRPGGRLQAGSGGVPSVAVQHVPKTIEARISRCTRANIGARTQPCRTPKLEMFC